MKKITAKHFRTEKAWGSEKITAFGNIGVKLHWTDTPYVWHKNDGDEVFVLMDGELTMQSRRNGIVSDTELTAGELLYIKEGEEHRAIPKGETRILVIEHMDSK